MIFPSLYSLGLSILSGTVALWCLQTDVLYCMGLLNCFLWEYWYAINYSIKQKKKKSPGQPFNIWFSIKDYFDNICFHFGILSNMIASKIYPFKLFEKKKPSLKICTSKYVITS